jgi:tetratricopeptide (TPR) repeat protein
VVRQKEKIGEDILGLYVAKNVIAEYKNRLKDLRSSKKKEISAIISKNKKQLEADTAELQRDELDLLVTFILENLPVERVMDCLMLLGESLFMNGETAPATIIYEQVLKLTTTNKRYSSHTGHINLKLGELYSMQARWRQGIMHLKRAEEYYDKMNDQHGSCNVANMLGTIYGDRGKIQLAKESFNKCLSKLDPVYNVSMYSMIEMNLGILSHMQGNYEEAFSCFQRALVTAEKLTHKRRTSMVKHNLGIFFTAKEEYKKALAEFDASIAIASEMNDLVTLELAYLGKATVYEKLNDLMLANAFADKSMKLSYKINDRLSIADAFKVKGVIERKLANYELAETYLQTSLRINKELDNILNMSETSLELGLLYNEINKKEAADLYFRKSLKGYKHIENAAKIKHIKSLLKELTVPVS